MGKRQLLFVTYRDENLEEGVSYAIELAKAMYEDITLLFVQKQSSLMDKLGNMMTAVSFAEAVKAAVAEASKTVRHMDWFEVVDERGRIVDGQVREFQVTIKVGFKIER